MTYRTLKTLSLEASTQIIASDNYTDLTLDSSASRVITDFQTKRPAMLEQDLSVDEALLVMRKSHVRSVIVIDKNETFLGLVTLADLESRKVLARAESLGVKRKDLTVRELMTPKAALLAIPMRQAQEARVGDMLQTLQHLGKPHILLSGPEGEVAGILSASEIARKLQIDLNISEKVTSFAEIYGVVSGGIEV